MDHKLPPIEAFRFSLNVSIITIAPNNAEHTDTLMRRTTHDISFFEDSVWILTKFYKNKMIFAAIYLPL